MASMFDKLDKPRPILFDIRAIRTAEQTLEIGIHQAFERMGPLTMITILWAGLSRKNRQLSYMEVEEMVQKAIDTQKLTMKALNTYLVKELSKCGAFSGYLDDDEDEDDKAPLAAVSN